MAKVHGVGVNDLGQRWYTESKENRKLYDNWHDILRKTHPSTPMEKKKYPRPKKVCQEWETLSNFVRDLKAMDNYDKWLDPVGERVSLVTESDTFCKEDCYFTSPSIKRKRDEDKQMEVLNKIFNKMKTE